MCIRDRGDIGKAMIVIAEMRSETRAAIGYDDDTLIAKAKNAHDKMCIRDSCNAGQLATVKYGTATAPIYLGQERGYNFHVFADETRPLLQLSLIHILRIRRIQPD